MDNLMGILNRREFTSKNTHHPEKEAHVSLTIKGIEAAKPKYNALSGKYVQTKLSDGDGLFLVVTENSKAWRARYFHMGKSRRFPLGNAQWLGQITFEKLHLLCKDLQVNPFHEMSVGVF